MIDRSIKEAWDAYKEKKSKYNKYFINRCFEAANMSHCKKLQVGAIAVRDNRTILDGWNGTIPGQENCCEDVEGKTKPTVIHAERNIIFYAAKKGISLEGATMYITHRPCIGCAQAMAAAGIAKVVYADDYKTSEGIDFLRQIKIKVLKVEV